MGWHRAPVRTQLKKVGLVGFVAGALGLARPSMAATQVAASRQDTLALTVQPRKMATGTRNPGAGEYPLEDFPWFTVSVPQQCTGPRRCPLVLFLPGAGQTASVIAAWLRPVAERYGLMLLAASDDKYQPLFIDSALKETLQDFAIDPEKIAIVGRCASGAPAVALGIHNSHVFSRIAAISGTIWPSSSAGAPPTLQGMDPKNTTTEFLVDDGFVETSRHNLVAVNELRQGGHPVRLTWTVRGHEHQADDYDLLGRWLIESWTKPPAERATPTFIDPLPLLTTEAVAKMTTFWAAFFKEPEWVRVTGRRSFIRDFIAPSGTMAPTDPRESFGSVRPVVPMTDMAAFAAQYPSVAAALKQAGLTGRQHDAYRLALLMALAVQGPLTPLSLSEIDPRSVLGKNLAFLAEHADEVQALSRVGIEGSFGGNCCSYPKLADELRPLGIWRTP